MHVHIRKQVIMTTFPPSKSLPASSRSLWSSPSKMITPLIKCSACYPAYSDRCVPASASFLFRARPASFNYLAHFSIVWPRSFCSILAHTMPSYPVPYITIWMHHYCSKQRWSWCTLSYIPLNTSFSPCGFCGRCHQLKCSNGVPHHSTCYKHACVQSCLVQ